MNIAASFDYALGYTETESQRLIRQGDVSLLAARLVGPTGAVFAQQAA